MRVYELMRLYCVSKRKVKKIHYSNSQNGHRLSDFILSSISRFSNSQNGHTLLTLLNITPTTSHSPESIGHVVPVGDVVVASRALAYVPEALFAKKICVFLATLDATNPRSSKMIDCLEGQGHQG